MSIQNEKISCGLRSMLKKCPVYADQRSARGAILVKCVRDANGNRIPVAYGKFVNPSISYDLYMKYKQLNGDRDWLPESLRPEPPVAVLQSSAPVIPAKVIAARSYAATVPSFLESVLRDYPSLFSETLVDEINGYITLAKSLTNTDDVHPVDELRNVVSNISAYIEESKAAPLETNSNPSVMVTKSASKKYRSGYDC